MLWVIVCENRPIGINAEANPMIKLKIANLILIVLAFLFFLKWICDKLIIYTLVIIRTNWIHWILTAVHMLGLVNVAYWHVICNGLAFNELTVRQLQWTPADPCSWVEHKTLSFHSWFFEKSKSALSVHDEQFINLLIKGLNPLQTVVWKLDFEKPRMKNFRHQAS